MTTDPPNYVEVTRGRSALRADLIEGLLEQEGIRYRRLGTRHGAMVEAAQAIFVQRFEVHPGDLDVARQLIADFDARASEEAPGESPDDDDLASYVPRSRLVLRSAFFVLAALLLLALATTCLPQSAAAP